MADPIDFNAFLAGDQTYQQALGAIEDARRADEAQRNAAVYQGLINYGELPQAPAGTSQAVTDFLNSIPQSVKDAVGLNTTAGLSQYAQRLQTQRDAQSLMTGNLGERGIIRSGDYAYLTNKNTRAEQLARAADLQGLLGGFNTTWQNYLDQLAGLRGETQTASQSAWQRMMDMINAKAAADALAAQTQPVVPDIPNPNANPNNPTLVPDRFVPTPTNTPGLNIPAVDEQGYAIPSGPLYPSLPSTPFTFQNDGGQLAPEPRTNIDTNAFGPYGVANPDPVYNTPTSTPDYSQPVSDYLQNQPSDAASYAYDQYTAPDYLQYAPSDAASYASEQYAAPAPEPVYQQPAGYGGTATQGQVRRNML